MLSPGRVQVGFAVSKWSLSSSWDLSAFGLKFTFLTKELRPHLCSPALSSFAHPPEPAASQAQLFYPLNHFHHLLPLASLTALASNQTQGNIEIPRQCSPEPIFFTSCRIPLPCGSVPQR